MKFALLREIKKSKLELPIEAGPMFNEEFGK